MVSVGPGKLKNSFSAILMKRFASGTRRRAVGKIFSRHAFVVLYQGKKVGYERRINLTPARWCMISRSGKFGEVDIVHVA